MSGYIRKLRGRLSISVIWGAVSAVFFGALITGVAILRPQDIDPGEGPIRAASILGGVGLLAGFIFAIILALAESGKSIREVALSRVAVWGVIASALFPLSTRRQDQGFVLCPIGALLALAIVAITRKAERSIAREPRRIREVVIEFIATSVGDTVNSPIHRSTTAD